MNDATFKGDMEAIKRLRSQGYPWDEWTCASAAENGHLEVLQWLRSPRSPDGKDSCHRPDGKDSCGHPCPWDDWTCNLAAKNGHLHILKWVRSQDPPCPWDSWTCARAASNGQFETLKWLRSQTPPDRSEDAEPRLNDTDPYGRPDGKDPYGRPDGKDPYGRPCPWGEFVCLNAAANGHLHILKWALEHGCPHNDELYKYIMVNQWYYDAICWLLQFNYFDDADAQKWIQAIDDQTNQLSLPTDLIQLIKHYV